MVLGLIVCPLPVRCERTGSSTTRIVHAVRWWQGLGWTTTSVIPMRCSCGGVIRESAVYVPSSFDYRAPSALCPCGGAAHSRHERFYRMGLPRPGGETHRQPGRD